MRDVSIIGIGQAPVGEHWDKSLRHLSYEALAAAMRDAGIERADAIYVGNMLSGEISGQAHLGSLIADFAGLDTLYNISVAVYEELKDPQFAPPILLKKMVKAGWLGRKTGKGFYDYRKSD